MTIDGVSAASGKNGGPHSAHYVLQNVDFRDFPAPKVTVNFPLELRDPRQGSDEGEGGVSAVGHSGINGATRMIPGTQHSHDVIPTPEEEPTWMKLSIACPVPAGAALIRDLRCWHSGTPNLSEYVRALPGQKYWASWYRAGSSSGTGSGDFSRTMSRVIYNSLSPHGQRICRFMVVNDGEEPRFEGQQFAVWKHATAGWGAPDHRLARL